MAVAMPPRMRWLALGSCLLAGAMGCVGDIGDGGVPGEKPTSSSGPLTCDPNLDASAAPLIRLSRLQYENTLRDLLGDVVDQPAVVEQLAQFPIDGETNESFALMDDRVSQRHVDTYYGVADALATAVSGDAARLEAIAGACAGEAPLTAICVEDFVRAFGRRVHRRALSDDEVARYAELMGGREGSDVFRAIVFVMLMSPSFNYHLELGGAPIDEREDHLRLSGYELASKLSYHFWQTMPDDALLDAAERGELDGDEGFAAAAARLFADERTKETVRRFYAEWYRLDIFGGFAETPAFEAFAAGVGADDALYAEMADEVHALADHFTWQTGGSYRDMLTSDLSFAGPRLAELYGVPAWDGGAPATFASGERSGLLTRAAFVVSSNERTNPFKRGSYVKKEILCDPLSQPDPNELPAGALDEPPIDPTKSTRERFAAKTASAECQTCHAQFSPLGFALEAYDGLGRFRSEEDIFSEEGELLATVPVDTAVEVPLGAEAVAVAGPVELMAAIAESGKPDTCFARHYFRYTYRRQEDDQADGCAMVAVRHALTDGAGLREALEAIALEPSFRNRLVEAAP